MTKSRGRPSKLTKDVHEKIVNAIRLGNYIETASAYAGVEKKSVYNWMKRGNKELDRLEKNPRARMKKEEQKYVEFLHAVQKALAEAEMRDVTIIGKAAEENWQAAAWRLERKFPDRWGRKDKQTLEHIGKEGGPIETSHTQKMDLSNLTDKELEELEKIITKSTDTTGDSEGEG